MNTFRNQSSSLQDSAIYPYFIETFFNINRYFI